MKAKVPKTKTRVPKKADVCSAVPYCPVVVMGASAGGLEVFGQFFSQMPPNSGLSFVLVQHLDPRHETLMPELLKKQTSMPVLRAEDGMKVQPNTVYVIAPNGTVLHVHSELSPNAHVSETLGAVKAFKTKR